MRVYIIILALLVGGAAPLAAQQKMWVYFTDKGPVAPVAKAGCDRPLWAGYLDSLRAMGIQPLVASRWLNAASAKLPHHQALAVARLPFVRRLAMVDTTLRAAPASTGPAPTLAELTTALQQIDGQALAANDLDGQGVKIGLLDGGFFEAGESTLLRHIIEEGRLIAYRNYTDPQATNPFGGSRAQLDYHGTKVWECVAGYDTDSGEQTGLAPKATFYLAKTDQGDKEYRAEEDYWVAALEWMDSLGVRLVNSSLGYSTGYDDPAENYTPQMVDGKSSAITRAATIAVEQKNMVIVISAGNEGHGKFKVLSLPADAQGLITVGATAYQPRAKMGYSSIGPENLGHLKPNVSCHARGGTSFAAPVITGLLACVLQAHPDITPKKLTQALEKSCHLYPYGNNYIGYGVPNAPTLLGILANQAESSRMGVAKSKADTLSLPSEGAKTAVLFHKKDKTNVLKQQLAKARKGQFIVIRHEEAQYTTVSWLGKTVEIKWQGKK